MIKDKTEETMIGSKTRLNDRIKDKTEEHMIGTKTRLKSL